MKIKNICYILAAILLSIPLSAHSHNINNGSEMHGPRQRLLPVSASAEIKSTPDKATVTAGVITEGKNSAETANENALKMTAIYEALRLNGIDTDDIKTSQVSLRPRYDYENKRKPRIVGYESHNIVTVNTFDLNKVGPIIDTLIQAGSNQISNIQFSLRDPEVIEAKVLDKAIRKARTKAQAMATSAGITLGPLQNLKVDGQGYSPFNQGYDEIIVTAQKRGSSAIKPRGQTPINYGDHTIRTTVHLVYEMR